MQDETVYIWIYTI